MRKISTAAKRKIIGKILFVIKLNRVCMRDESTETP
jgi:hypothetical protein